ncbi:type II toxin-antitoxin system VapC family toxin [soil metagenome]
MRILLDTHVLLWWLLDDPQLGPRVRAKIADGRNEVFVSSVTVAEIAIKRALGKLPGPHGLLTSLTEEGFQELPLLSTHASALETLPQHHRDPFDRMLIAQALTESMTFATYDAVALRYDVQTITG